jgi:SWI/SNF-related matrix-associated actin-dependent regulator of chromatin subfamily A member 5
MQDVDETPDFTDDSDTNPNTTASSVVGEPTDGRKRRSEATLLRRSVFGKKHDRLGESKVYRHLNLTMCEDIMN